MCVCVCVCVCVNSHFSLIILCVLGMTRDREFARREGGGDGIVPCFKSVIFHKNKG